MQKKAAVALHTLPCAAAPAGALRPFCFGAGVVDFVDSLPAAEKKDLDPARVAAFMTTSGAAAADM
jgi:hypothetical protein